MQRRRGWRTMVEFGQVNSGVFLVDVILVLAVVDVDVDVEVSANWERVLLLLLLLLSRTVLRGSRIHPCAGGLGLLRSGLRRAQNSIEQLVTDRGMMLGQTLYGKDGLDCSGSLVDLSPDDNTLAFGSPGYYEDGDRTGYVRVFALKVGIDNNIGTTHLEADGRRHRWRHQRGWVWEFCFSFQ